MNKFRHLGIMFYIKRSDIFSLFGMTDRTIGVAGSIIKLAITGQT